MTGGVVAVQLRQADVEQNHVGTKLLRRGDRFKAIVRGARPMARGVQQQGERRRAVPVVVDDENPADDHRGADLRLRR